MLNQKKLLDQPRWIKNIYGFISNRVFVKNLGQKFV